MVTLDDLFAKDPAERAKRATAEAGAQALKLAAAALYGIGWLLAKTVMLILVAIGGFFYGLGWTVRRIVWPALTWMGAAVKLGWEEGGRRGGDRGTA